MIVRSIKTDKIVAGHRLSEVLDKHLTGLEEGSVLAITSKIVGICEGQIVPIGSIEINELVKRESDYFLDPA
jgi:dihydrofolate synthase / folylpolyglutamate synthase